MRIVQGCQASARPNQSGQASSLAALVLLALAWLPCFANVAIKQECTRITPMDKDELKERIRVPLLGFSAVLMSIVAFLLLLYGITVVVRFLFALGSLG